MDILKTRTIDKIPFVVPSKNTNLKDLIAQCLLCENFTRSETLYINVFYLLVSFTLYIRFEEAGKALVTEALKGVSKNDKRNLYRMKNVGGFMSVCKEKVGVNFGVLAVTSIGAYHVKAFSAKTAADLIEMCLAERDDVTMKIIDAYDMPDNVASMMKVADYYY
ncbi:unnamed protein product [Mucor hiemalis]